MNYNNAVFETSAGDVKGLIPSDLNEICFSGHSNVGKSSLINKLLGRKALARTSNTPGKTATVNFFRCENVRFADLPGYGFAKVSFAEKQKWAALMEGYFNSSRNISLVFQLVDARHTPTKDDMDMLHYLCDNGFKFVIVLTKIDKLNKSEREKNLKMLDEVLIFTDGFAEKVTFSAVTGEGTDRLREIVENYN